MPFAEYTNNNRSNLTKYFDFTPGEHRIRILDSKAHSEKTHWIRGYKVRCLDEGCPACAKEENGYPNRSYYVNVFDKTPVKVCPNKDCNRVIKSSFGRYPKVCPSCETPIEHIPEKPFNTVVILTGGKRLFVDQLNALYEEFGDLTEYDLDVLVTGTGRERQIVVRPSKERGEKPEVSTKYDLSNITITLSAKEMERLINENITIKELLANRNNKPSSEQVSKVKKSVENLFSE